ncbi:MAG: MFS transporter [Terracidiphilus sp.]|nr:MFS transporter [Terracidiphilus sp.]
MSSASGLAAVQEDSVETTVTAGARAARARWGILALLLAITIINFIDRQTVSILAPLLRQTLHLSNEQYGRIVAAFQFGMMSGEFPMGWLMDRWGVRLGLAGAVLWWSAATGVQSITRSGIQLGVARFWMGTSECGNYSGGIKAIFRLFSSETRTLAIGIFNSGSMIGATLAPPLIIFIEQRYGIRAAFLIPASLGALWAPLWLFCYRDASPAKQVRTRAESLRSLLGQSSTWAVMLCRFFIGPVMQFYWYWIPSYLYSERHLTLLQLGFLSWIPFLLGDAGGVAGGWTAGWLQRRGIGTYNVRRLTMYSSAAVCILSMAVPHIASSAVAFLTIGVAVMADNFLSANMFAAVTDLFPDSAIGRATGLTGVASGLSGLLFPLLTGYLVDQVSYAPVFLMVAVMPLIGTVLLFVLAKPYRSEQKALAL